MKNDVLHCRTTKQSASLAVLFASSIAIFAQHQDVKVLAQQADSALQSGSYEQAIADYQQVLKFEPDSAAAWSNLGSAWFAKGEFFKASRSYVHASQLQPANTDYSFNAALSLIRLDKCDDAEVYLQRSLQIDFSIIAFVQPNQRERRVEGIVGIGRLQLAGMNV